MSVPNATVRFQIRLKPALVVGTRLLPGTNRLLGQDRTHTFLCQGRQICYDRGKEEEQKNQVDAGGTDGHRYRRGCNGGDGERNHMGQTNFMAPLGEAICPWDER